MDLNASKQSELFHIVGLQCLQSIRHQASHPTSKPVNQSASQPSNKQASKPAKASWRPVGRLKGASGGRQPPQEGSDDGGGVFTTLEIWRSPGSTRPGTKYPVRESLTWISCLLSNMMSSTDHQTSPTHRLIKYRSKPCR